MKVEEKKMKVEEKKMKVKEKKMKKIKPYTTILNEANACWMARISKEIYEKNSNDDPRPNETKILENLQKEDENFKSVKGYSENSAQAALIEHDDYLCMAFRGTDELADWLDNVKVFYRKELFGEFHRGFWCSVEDVWHGLFAEYKALSRKKRRPLFITGHSLGGAMATIAGAKLIHEDLPFTSIYTFGQPRAMTRDTSRIFNNECKGRFFRFHNNNDLVTRVPARLMGYSHVGTYIYISTEGKLHNDPGFWFRFLDYVDGAIESATEKGIDGIEDHDMAKYLAAIKKWKPDFA